MATCPECYGSNIIKKGTYIVNRGEVQRYQCKNCGHRFIEDEYKNLHFNSKYIEIVVDLMENGMFSREVASYMKEKYNCKISSQTVVTWHRKYRDDYYEEEEQ